MLKQLTTTKPVILLIIFIAAMFFAGQADAQTKVSGKMTVAYVGMDSILVGDIAGHNMTLGESKGTNSCTSGNDFLEGAEVVNISYSDLAMGSGPHQGYVTLKKGDDMAVAKWQGQVTTTMTAEGVHNTAFMGTYEYVKGAGQFSNMAGKGTYKGQFTSKTEYTVDWEGEYTLK